MTLHLVLKREYFEQIKSGEKRVEYRQIKPYWAKRLAKKPQRVVFYDGYKKGRESLEGEIIKIEQVPCPKQYQNFLKGECYAIHFKLIPSENQSRK